MNKQYFNALGVLKPKCHLNKHAKSNIGIKSLDDLVKILPLSDSGEENKTEGLQQNAAETRKNFSQRQNFEKSTSCDIKTPKFDLNYYEVPELYRKSSSDLV